MCLYSRNIFDTLLKFHGASHISSVNLIACTGTLCTIAKLRPALMPPVVEALNKLNSNLPPTLTDSQVSSVRKQMKMQLLNILRQPSSFELQSKIIRILTDVGASKSEIGRAIPRLSAQEQQKRMKRAAENNAAVAAAQAAKKPRIEVEAKAVEMEVDTDEVAEQLAKSNKLNETFIAEQIKTVDTVISLVLHYMMSLPEDVPQQFQVDYKPYTWTTMEDQIQRIAKLLAEQMSAKRVGPGAGAITKDPPMRQKVSAEEEKSIIHGLRSEPMDTQEKPEQFDYDDEEGGEDEAGETAGGNEDDPQRKEEVTKKLREHLEKFKGDQLIPKMKQRAKTLKLQEITKPLPKEVKEKFLLDCVQRMLKAEKVSIVGGVSSQYRRILIVLGSSFNTTIRDMITKFIFEDPKSRIDFAFAWLFEEYSIAQGFSRYSHVKAEKEKKTDTNYSHLLMDLIRYTLAMEDAKKKSKLIRRIYLEAPLLTMEAMNYLIEISERTELNGMELVRELLIIRPPKRLLLLAVLLKFAVHNNTDLRDMAHENVLRVFEEQIMTQEIEEYALKWLNFLELAEPPEEFFHSDYGRADPIFIWTEDLAKVALGLFLVVMPCKAALVQDLCRVYTATSSDMKRTILRAIETPIRKMGADNPELLGLIESCPKGAETLVTRIVYILAEKEPPTMELVNKVRELYQSKVSDVRFLIPVVNSLTKSEILAALPRFLKLSEAVVKDVFKRLLGIGQEYTIPVMPITPTELLVALHKLDSSKVELRLIMQATTLCLTEKDTFTHEVLAVVLQQLVEISPLPTLLMRTVIQSLSLYPRLGGFVTNLLQRLILKQVWKQKVVWEGFLKCSQRLLPQSLPVLIQLPPQQLQDALKFCPELREPLLEHAKSIDELGGLSKQQVIDILSGKDEERGKQPLPPGEE